MFLGILIFGFGGIFVIWFIGRYYCCWDNFLEGLFLFGDLYLCVDWVIFFEVLSFDDGIDGWFFEMNYEDDDKLLLLVG